MNGEWDSKVFNSFTLTSSGATGGAVSGFYCIGVGRLSFENFENHLWVDSTYYVQRRGKVFILALSTMLRMHDKAIQYLKGHLRIHFDLRNHSHCVTTVTG